MLFKTRFHDGLRAGSIRLTFRHWSRPQVRVGGRYRVGADIELAVTRVERVPVAGISADDAQTAGFSGLDELLRFLARSGVEGDDLVYRIAFEGRCAPPLSVADGELSAEDLETLVDRLEAMDRRSRKGPWVVETLSVVGQHPQRRAGDLAPEVGRDTRVFKADVRKLKKLGLTRSYEIGYELTPRGRQAVHVLKGDE